MGRDGMNRREFLGWLGKGAAVGAAGGLILPAAKKIWQVPVQLKAKPSRTRVHKAQSFGRFYGYGDCIDFGQGEVITEKALTKAMKEMVENFTPEPVNLYLPPRTYESLEASLKEITFEVDNIKGWNGVIIGEEGRAKQIMNDHVTSLLNRVEKELFS